MDIPPDRTAVAGEVAQSLDVEVRGEIAETDVKVLELAALMNAPRRTTCGPRGGWAG